MERNASRHCNHWQFWNREIKFYQHNQRVSVRYNVLLLFFPSIVLKICNEFGSSKSLAHAIKWDENQPSPTKRNSFQYQHNIITKPLLEDLSSNCRFRKIQDGILTSILELFSFVLCSPRRAEI